MYKFDYNKYFVHPDTPNTIYIKTRVYGVSGGIPFDEIKWKIINEQGIQNEITSILPNLNAKYAFIAEMKQVDLKDNNFEYLN
jgi:hypothetical protein